MNAKRSDGNSRDALSHFAADKFFEFGILAFSTPEEMPLLLKEESDGESNFAFVDEQLLNEKMKGWKRKREKAEEKIVFIV